MKNKITKLIRVICGLMSGLLFATTINIPADYSTIQAGLNAASEGDTVQVAAGTYVENINYNGKNITVASLFLTTQDTSYISQTIIDGNQAGRVVTFAQGESSDAVLCGFTIQNGNADYGGGICCSNQSSPLLRHLVIRSNVASSKGGGVFCTDKSSPLLKYVKVVDNSSDGSGGGIFAESESCPRVTKSVITSNVCNQRGGGLYVSGLNSSVYLSGTTIVDNHAQYGGGCYFLVTTPTLENVTIRSNNADKYGGGIYLNGSPGITFEGNDSNIITNTAKRGNDIFSDHTPMGIVYQINLHSFSVSPPTDYYATPIDDFSFRVENGLVDLTEGDVFVSPRGDNTNDGMSSDTPFRNIDFAFSRVIPPYGINILQGVYSNSTNGEDFPVYPISDSPLYSLQDETAIFDGQGKTSLLRYLFVQFDEVSERKAIEYLTLQNGVDICGGGISVERSSSLVFDNIVLLSNTAYMNGGGMYVEDSEIRLDNSVVDSNTIVENASIQTERERSGAGIYCYGSNFEANASRIMNNVSAYKGGGIRCQTSDTITLRMCEISNNTSNLEGGGLFFNGLDNVVLLEKCTIADNQSDGFGGGLLGSWSAKAYVSNSVLWGNSPESVVENNGANIEVEFSDIEGGWDGVGNINLPPLFVDPENGNYHLQSNSPCIDAGNWDDQDPDGSRIDMGAYYFNQEKGDLDGDAEFTVLDVMIVAQIIMGQIEPTARELYAGDVNGDGIINVQDVMEIVQLILGAPLESLPAGDIYIAGVMEAMENEPFDAEYDVKMLNDEMVRGVHITVHFGDQYKIKSLSKEVKAEPLELMYHFREDSTEVSFVLVGLHGEALPAGEGSLVKMQLKEHDVLGKVTSFGGSEFLQMDLANDGDCLLDYEIVDEGGYAKAIAGENPVGLKIVDFVLNDNFPNPFNPVTVISYVLPEMSEVRLQVFDVRGRLVATLVDGVQDAGQYAKQWDASGYSSGIYFYQLQAGIHEDTRKMVVFK